MNWEIFLGIAALIAFLISIGKPFAKLIKTMTELTFSLISVKEAFSEFAIRNGESHDRLWKHNEEQDEEIENHEKRITKIELQIELDTKKQ